MSATQAELAEEANRAYHRILLELDKCVEVIDGGLHCVNMFPVLGEAYEYIGMIRGLDAARKIVNDAITGDDIPF